MFVYLRMLSSKVFKRMGEFNEVSFLGTQAAATLALNLLCLHAASPAHVPMYHKSGNCVTPVGPGARCQNM